MIEGRFKKIIYYVFHENMYKEQFILAYNNKLYDFSVILLWKIFILFSYEKITQYRKIKGDEEFVKIWKINELEKEDLLKYDIENIFTYNKIEDNKLINLLSRLYSIDENFFKKLRHLKNTRDVASHVTDTILANTEDSLKFFMDDLEKIMKAMNDLHLNKLILNCDLWIWGNLDLSGVDKKFLLNKSIEELAMVLSFDSATVTIDRILNLKDVMDENDLDMILKNSGENINGSYNQVLDGKSSIRFIQNLLAFSYEKGWSLDLWKIFYNKLDNHLKEKFIDVRLSLKKRGVKGVLNPDGIIDPEDIPF